MKIILDVMGADHDACELVRGAVLAKKEYGVEICLVGDAEAIRGTLAEQGENEADYEIVPTEDVLTMEDDPISIRRVHRDCSMATALKLLAEGRGDAAVSAGNTGALFIGATGFIHCMEGVRRAALASILPFAVPILLLDSGANAEVTPDFLTQFAVLGSYYMRDVMGVENPRVGLVNNGTESHKGTPLYREAHGMLKTLDGVNFVGNVEGKAIPEGVCDVAVCDGFTGNVLLKTAEGVSKFVMTQVKGMFTGPIGKLAGLCVLKKSKAMKKRFDAKEYGGAPFLGLRKPVVKAHGNSDARAIKNAIRQAIAYAESGVIDKMEARLSVKES